VEGLVSFMHEYCIAIVTAEIRLNLSRCGVEHNTMFIRHALARMNLEWQSTILLEPENCINMQGMVIICHATCLINWWCATYRSSTQAMQPQYIRILQ